MNVMISTNRLKYKIEAILIFIVNHSYTRILVFVYYSLLKLNICMKIFEWSEKSSAQSNISKSFVTLTK